MLNGDDKENGKKKPTLHVQQTFLYIRFSMPLLHTFYREIVVCARKKILLLILPFAFFSLPLFFTWFGR